jgi:hypothetical protein
MDLWVERSEENYLKIEQAFKQFGMPVFDMTKENFLHHPSWDVFTFGTPPVAIDLIIAKRKAGRPKDLDDLENLR